MRLICAVFKALKTFARPATVRELCRESGLSRGNVHKGLRGLSLRDLLIKDAPSRRRGTYGLRSGAELPEEIRGKFVRDEPFRDRQRRAALGYSAARRPSDHPLVAATVVTRAAVIADSRHSAARPPPSCNAPGAARHVIREIVSAAPGNSVAIGCELAVCWKGVPPE